MATPLRDFELLKRIFDEHKRLYQECVSEVSKLGLFSRLLTQPWLAEIGLQLVQLERMIVNLQESQGNPPAELNTAWTRHKEVIAALSPVADRAPEPAQSSGMIAALSPAADRAPEPAQPSGAPIGKRVARAAGRLKLVFAFLLFQVIGAVAVLLWAVSTFGRSDPQTTVTAEQWEEHDLARAEVSHVSLLAQEWAQAAPLKPDSNRTHPETSASRATVEGLVATLTDMRLAERDLRTANRYLENVLALLDEADFTGAAKQLKALESAFASDSEERPISPIRLIVLGSLLGMLTITIHLNWKFRNRWDTVGFLPWYLTRLIAAPVLSLAALGLLFQVSFTTDLTQDSEISSLGLRGASPLTIFAVAVITGLFSNRVYDWLRRRMEANATPQPARPGAVEPAAVAPSEGEGTA